MPELPEVEVVRAGLEPIVTGATIASVAVLDERSLRRHDGPGTDFVHRLVGRTFEVPQRRGKFMWLPIGDGEALVTHLGMSGQVLLRPPGVDDRLTRIRLELRHPVHGEVRMNFVDQRIFGSMAIDELVTVTDSGADFGQTVPTAVAHIARDPLDPHFDESLFFDRLARRNSGIKASTQKRASDWKIFPTGNPPR